MTIPLTAPVDGHYTLIGTTYVDDDDLGDVIACSISQQTEPPALDDDYSWQWQSGGALHGSKGVIAGTRVIAVTEGTTTDVGYVCENVSDGLADFHDTTLSAIFTPAP